MNSAIEAGFEGIVVKSFKKKYYDKGASLKCKKFETVDVVVCGYVQGRGKYSDTIGALQVGYYDPDKDEVIRISNVNCSTDAERNAWRDNWEDWKNTVIEVLCQEVTERSLRHPRYVRRREDKDYKRVDFKFDSKIKDKYKGKTFYLKTYGCQMNEHDSENIEALLTGLGFKKVDNYENADLVLLNTCSIRENAHNKAFGMLGRLKHLKAQKKEG